MNATGLYAIIGSSLYIPIWLYSNIWVGLVLIHLLALYIPIWLYSNSACKPCLGFRCNFTFQSGYIQINNRTVPACQWFTLYIPIWLYSN